METLRVAMVSTAQVGIPGSMRVYADLLVQTLSRHAPEVEARLLELGPHPSAGAWGQRAATLALPWRARRSRGIKPDIWHVLDGSRAYVAEGLRGAPVVITAHDIIPVLQQHGRFPGAPATGAAARWLWRRNAAALRRAEGVVCVSASTRDDLDREFGPGIQTRVVPMPVRPQLLAGVEPSLPRESGTLLHVGNNSFYKNRAQVLRIFAAMDRSLARRLVMIGAPPTPALRSLAHELGIVEMLAWIVDAGDAEVAGWYARASVLVFPSLYEGFGWPVLEAMAAGLPVVVSDRGSLPEVVADAAPCLDPQDCSGFVREVEYLLKNPEAHAKRSQAVRLRAQSFSIERFARETCAAYLAAVSQSPLRAA